LRIVLRRTEVLGTLLDHLAIDFPQAIAGIDDLAGIGADLISGDDVLWLGPSQSQLQGGESGC
jgi:hypothetical protein